jgi:hypothetical protein
VAIDGGAVEDLVRIVVDAGCYRYSPRCPLFVLLAQHISAQLLAALCSAHPTARRRRSAAAMVIYQISIVLLLKKNGNNHVSRT